MVKPTIIVNGVPLDHAEGWWMLENATTIPGTFTNRIASVQLAGVDGAAIAGITTLDKGSFAVSIAVQGETFSILQERIAMLQRAFYRDVTIEMVMGDGTTRLCSGVTSSFTVESNVLTHAKILATVTLPYPVWREQTTRSGEVTPSHEVELEALAGGSAPVDVRWTLPTDASYLNIFCASGLGRICVAPGERLDEPVVIRGWRNYRLGNRLESWGRISPDAEGRYRVEIDTDAATIKWSGRRSFL